MAITCNKLIIKSENNIALGDPTDLTGSSGLFDSEANAFINDATVTIEEWLDKETNTRIAGFTPTVAMSFIATSNGIYRAKVGTTVGDNLVAGNEYEIEVKAVTVGGVVKTFFLQVFAERGG